MALVSRRFVNSKGLQAAANNSPPIRLGTSGEAVVLMQRALIDLGFSMPISTDRSSGLPDGIFGSETARTVRTFQAQRGLVQDGVAGRSTLSRLDGLMAAAEEAELRSLPFRSLRDFITTARLGR
jgi:peptidoglycan hydrolase-like protein with peptidoglycan-binding domain